MAIVRSNDVVVAMLCTRADPPTAARRKADDGQGAFAEIPAA
jgi:hypothetical protein